MHDEANPSLFAILNQMTTGLEFLSNNSLPLPRFSWHIDPFGATATRSSSISTQQHHKNQSAHFGCAARLFLRS
jgi:hypothetical protein